MTAPCSSRSSRYIYNKMVCLFLLNMGMIASKRPEDRGLAVHRVWAGRPQYFRHDGGGLHYGKVTQRLWLTEAGQKIMPPHQREKVQVQFARLEEIFMCSIDEACTRLGELALALAAKGGISALVMKNSRLPTWDRGRITPTAMTPTEATSPG